jgi:predicted CoA-binding protein
MMPVAGIMNHDAYDDSYIRGILNTVKTIAMVGASAKDNRPSYFAFKYLAERGYNMIPINPGLAGKELLGRKIYARLSDVPEPIDMVDVFRASNYALRAGGADALAAPARDLDAAWCAQQRSGHPRRSERHEGRDEPLPEDRIRPAFIRN